MKTRPGINMKIASQVKLLVAIGWMSLAGRLLAEIRPRQVAAESGRTTRATTAGPALVKERCAGCHEMVEVRDWILRTSHRVLFTDQKRPEKKRGCQACHRPTPTLLKVLDDIEELLKLDKSDLPKLMPAFRRLTPAQANEVCMSCHSQDQQAAFDTTGHGRDGRTSCLACHSIHAGSRDKLMTAEEPAVCYKCHPGVRAQMNMPSHHPVREGKMKCTGCHNPHGSLSGTRGMLVRESVNETCMKCHSNLAGPWTFEHPPAAKDCLICHRAHGSVNQQLLAQPEAALCVKCHNPEHVGFAARVDRVKSLQRQLAYQSCSHCHPRIHGSDQDHGFTN